MFPHTRPRRLRQTPAIRGLVRENNLSVNDLICPLFVTEGLNEKSEISSMPNYFRFSPDLLLKEIEELAKLGIKVIAIFPIIKANKKTECAKEALNPNGLIPQTIRLIKKDFPEICLITDIALDPYTTHGHDGICDSQGNILNDVTVDILSKMALIHAQAGVDIVAPSDMMDGRVLAIRNSLDQANFQNTLILSYSAKYASCFYGPFRDALYSNLKFGDKKTYQLDCANVKEAEKEVLLDVKEGADLVMVKPALAYLDVIQRISQIVQIPIIAYSVSGEYSMIKAAAQRGWVDETQAIMEMMLSFKRAGATAIISYFSKDMAKLLKD